MARRPSANNFYPHEPLAKDGAGRKVSFAAPVYLLDDITMPSQDRKNDSSFFAPKVSASCAKAEPNRASYFMNDMRDRSGHLANRADGTTEKRVDLLLFRFFFLLKSKDRINVD